MDRRNKGNLAGDLIKIGLGALAGAAAFYFTKKAIEQVEAKQAEEVKEEK